MGILKIPRITTAQRTTTGGGITPAEGELLFDTDNKKIYKGDGLTLGGVEVGGGTGGGILVVAVLFSIMLKRLYKNIHF